MILERRICCGCHPPANGAKNEGLDRDASRSPARDLMSCEGARARSRRQTEVETRGDAATRDPMTVDDDQYDTWQRYCRVNSSARGAFVSS